MAFATPKSFLSFFLLFLHLKSLFFPHQINVLLQAYISQLKLEGFALMADMVYVTQVKKKKKSIY